MSFTVVRKEIPINAPISKVWNVITNPLLITQWLSDAEMSVTSDWKVGNPILFEGTWNNMDHTAKGTILKFENEKVFQSRN